MDGVYKLTRKNLLYATQTILNAIIIVPKGRKEYSDKRPKTNHLHYPCNRDLRFPCELYYAPFQQQGIGHMERRHIPFEFPKLGRERNRARGGVEVFFGVEASCEPFDLLSTARLVLFSSQIDRNKVQGKIGWVSIGRAIAPKPAEIGQHFYSLSRICNLSAFC